MTINPISLNPNELEKLASDIVKQAQAKGATDAAVSISSNKGYTVTAREGDVETIEYHQDKIIEINVFFNQSLGASSISDLRPEAIRDAVDAACHIAKFTDRDPASGLADKDQLAFDYPQLETSFPSNLTVDEAIKLACECESEAFKIDKRIVNSEGASVMTSDALEIYANSQGFVGSYPYSSHEISCILIAKEGDDMQRDFSYSVAADFRDLQSIVAIAKKAAQNTVSRLGAQRLPTMKSPVVFIAEEARGLIGHFVAAVSGGSIYRKASFLIDHLGKKVFPDFFHLQEFPHLAKGLGSVPFDNDGVFTRSNVFVENGILSSYLLSVYSAKKLGMQTTGNAGGSHNLTVRDNGLSLEELIKKMGKGLLVTELMGQGINLLNGDYSRGATGFWIENGVIQYPVHEITIAGNLRDMYANIIAVGNDVDKNGNIRTGSILVEEMTIAGS